MKRNRVLTWLGVAVLSLSVGFISEVNDDYLEISKNLDIFGHLYREVNTLYVDDTDPSKLMRTGIDAMLSSLDPYTNFIGEEDLEDFRFMSTGQYGGIGALVGKRQNKIVILEPYADTPADQAGLKAGDQIVEVNGQAVDGNTMAVLDVRNLLRGSRGTTISMKIKRPGIDSPLTLSIRRDRIVVDNVSYTGWVEDGIGYIALSGFTQDAGKEVQEAVSRFQKENPQLKGLILDLRNNPGGRLDESIRIANVFLEQRELIVETRGRIQGSKQSYYAQRPPIAPKVHLAVLVNRGSASASEIVAGAIQDLDRGVIIGQRSFGKGLVQNIRPLAYRTQLKVTTAKYYTPSGRCIQAINYAERNEDGSVSRIPDSLRSSFQTQAGRVVRDGGGIGPDIEVEKAALPLVARALQNQGLIFNYVTQYVAEHPEISSPEEFELDEASYQDFIKFTQTAEFSYQTPADKELEALKETVEEEAYAELLNEELLALEKELAQQKEDDLSKYRAPISRLIKEEILTRYYYEAGAIKGMITEDPEVAAAIEILNQPKDYEKILQGEEK